MCPNSGRSSLATSGIAVVFVATNSALTPPTRARSDTRRTTIGAASDSIAPCVRTPLRRISAARFPSRQTITTGRLPPKKDARLDPIAPAPITPIRRSCQSFAVSLISCVSGRLDTEPRSPYRKRG